MSNLPHVFLCPKLIALWFPLDMFLPTVIPPCSLVTSPAISLQTWLVRSVLHKFSFSSEIWDSLFAPILSPEKSCWLRKLISTDLKPHRRDATTVPPILIQCSHYQLSFVFSFSSFLTRVMTGALCWHLKRCHSCNYAPLFSPFCIIFDFLGKRNWEAGGKTER